MIQRLPLFPGEANYRVATTLDGIEYLFDVRWNGRDAAWYIDVSDANGELIRAGCKVALGAALGARVTDERWPEGLFIALDLTEVGADAEFNDFGSRVVIDYIPAADVEEL